MKKEQTIETRKFVLQWVEEFELFHKGYIAGMMLLVYPYFVTNRISVYM